MKRAVLLVLCVFLAASCTLGEREEWSDAIHDAHEAMVKARTANVFIEVKFKAIEIIGTVAPEPLMTSLIGEVDLKHRTAHLKVTKPKKADFYMTSMTEYLPRSEAGKSKKKWVSINFKTEPEDDIDVQDRRFSLGAVVIPPSSAVDLLEGVLTGSIIKKGSQTIRGQQATHYEAKLSQDNAQREISNEDQRTGIARIFETMGVGDDVFPVGVWLDSEDRVVQIRLDLPQKQDRVNSFKTSITYSFDTFGKGVKIVRPTDALKTDDFETFVTEYIRETVTP